VACNRKTIRVDATVIYADDCITIILMADTMKRINGQLNLKRIDMIRVLSDAVLLDEHSLSKLKGGIADALPSYDLNGNDNSNTNSNSNATVVALQLSEESSCSCSCSCSCNCKGV
jgi:hypothetical protein